MRWIKSMDQELGSQEWRLLINSYIISHSSSHCQTMVSFNNFFVSDIKRYKVQSIECNVIVTWLYRTRSSSSSATVSSANNATAAVPDAATNSVNAIESTAVSCSWISHEKHFFRTDACVRDAVSSSIFFFTDCQSHLRLFSSRRRWSQFLGWRCNRWLHSNRRGMDDRNCPSNRTERDASCELRWILSVKEVLFRRWMMSILLGWMTGLLQTDLYKYHLRNYSLFTCIVFVTDHEWIQSLLSYFPFVILSVSEASGNF